MNLSSLHWKADSFFTEENNFTYFYIFGCIGTLAAESRGYSLVVVQGLLIAVASLVAEHGLWGMWAQYSSWVLVHRLNHCTCMGLAASLRVGSGIRILNHCIAREVSMITYYSLHSSFGNSPPPFPSLCLFGSCHLSGAVSGRLW